MTILSTVTIIIVVLILLALALAVRIIKQYEQGVLFRLGRVLGARQPGLRVIIPFVDVLHRVSLRIVTMPIQSQGIITRDNVSVDVSAVAYFRVVDAVKSVVAIENVHAAINQIAQTTLRKVVGQHTLDETLSETDRINVDIREILDVSTVDWGVGVTLVELKDIQLPDSMKRAMARQAEAEREKRAKIINAEGESLAAAALGDASDTMMAHPLALQLRNLQSLVEIGVDKNTTVVFPGAADEHHRRARVLPRPRGRRRRPAGGFGGLSAMAGVGAGGAAAAASRARQDPSSPTVLISGAGNTTVVFLSTPISTRLCRLRSCSASGCAIMVSEASPRAAAASDSPSALMIFARFSRSASAWRAIARFMLSGNWMSLSSTRVTSTPQSTVETSRISRMSTLIRSVSTPWTRR